MDRRTESDAYEPTVQNAQVGSKSTDIFCHVPEGGVSVKSTLNGTDTSQNFSLRVDYEENICKPRFFGREY